MMRTILYSLALPSLGLAPLVVSSLIAAPFLRPLSARASPRSAGELCALRASGPSLARVVFVATKVEEPKEEPEKKARAKKAPKKAARKPAKKGTAASKKKRSTGGQRAAPRKPRRKKRALSFGSLSFRPYRLAEGRRSVRRERALLQELEGELVTRRSLAWRRQLLPPGSYLIFVRPVKRGGQELQFVDPARWKEYLATVARSQKARKTKGTKAQGAPKTAPRDEAEQLAAQGVRLRVPLRESVVEESVPALSVEARPLGGERVGFTLRVGQSSWQANLRFASGKQPVGKSSDSKPGAARAKPRARPDSRRKKPPE